MAFGDRDLGADAQRTAAEVEQDVVGLLAGLETELPAARRRDDVADDVRLAWPEAARGGVRGIASHRRLVDAAVGPQRQAQQIGPARRAARELAGVGQLQPNGLPDHPACLPPSATAENKG